MPKKKINGFAKYMFDLKKTYPDLSMEEVQRTAGENWQKMDEKEKSKYKSESKQSNEGKELITRYNCLGQSIDEVKQQENEKRQKEIKDTEFIDDIIKSAFHNNNLLDEEFYFFASNYYIKWESDIYPAEIAVAKFSLREGITNEFHTFINPGELPLGFASTALLHSKKTHRLPIFQPIGEKNYHKILNEILDFLEVKELSSNFVPPFYVFADFEGDEYSAALLILEKIANENKSHNAFRVLKAEELLFTLNRHALMHLNREDQFPFRSMIQAKDAMRRDNYRYSDIGCPLHSSEDNSQACALSKVKRWGFSISEHCGINSIDKIPGQHFPILNACCDDFGDLDDNLSESCLTESFHRLQLESTMSQSSQHDATSVLSDDPKLSSIPSQSDLHSNPSKQFISRLRARTSNKLRNFNSYLTASESDLSEQPSVRLFNSMRSEANTDTVNNFGESYTKKIVKNHLGNL